MLINADKYRVITFSFTKSILIIIYILLLNLNCFCDLNLLKNNQINCIIVITNKLEKNLFASCFCIPMSECKL